jgi:hypothetical protein
MTFFSFPAFEPFIQIGVTSSETTKTTLRTVFYEKNALNRRFLERRDVKLENWAAATIFRWVRNVPSSARIFLCGTKKGKFVFAAPVRHTFLTSALDGGEWHPLNKRRCGKEKNFLALPGI